MIEIELEKTYLAKYLPEGVLDCPYKEIIDIYLPKEVEHPILRLRKKGDSYEITKKTPVRSNDSSEQTEHTIKLTREEFDSLTAGGGKNIRKYRYYYNKDSRQTEVDIFKDELEGLVVIDFEFSEVVDKNNFVMPDFCLADVTQDKVFAGGMLCGKKYKDIEKKLKEFNYQKITI